MIYFSATGTARVAAERIASITDADIYEIPAAVPYTDDDLSQLKEDLPADSNCTIHTCRYISGTVPEKCAVIINHMGSRFYRTGMMLMVRATEMKQPMRA